MRRTQEGGSGSLGACRRRAAATRRDGWHGARTVLSCLLALVMSFAGVPATAVAEAFGQDDAQVGAWTASPDEGGVADDASSGNDDAGVEAGGDVPSRAQTEGPDDERADESATPTAVGDAPQDFPQQASEDDAPEGPASEQDAGWDDGGEDVADAGNGDSAGDGSSATVGGSDSAADNTDVQNADGSDSGDLTSPDDSGDASAHASDDGTGEAGESVSQGDGQEGDAAADGETDGAASDDGGSTAEDGFASDDGSSDVTTSDGSGDGDAATDGTSDAATDGTSDDPQGPANGTDDDSSDQPFANRLIVRMGEEGRMREADDVLGVVEDSKGCVALLGFCDTSQMDEAADYYAGCADWVAVDTTLYASRAGGADQVAYSEAENPIDALSEVPAEEASEGALIALLDTGVPAGEDPEHAVSFMGDDVADNNGHATAMLLALREQNPQATVRFVKVLDDHGRGTASSVYAGVVHAVDSGCAIVNLSLAGADVDGNAAIKEAVEYALSHGVIVVAAAGNGGKDAANVTPANIEGVLTVGAAEDGHVADKSNYGACVDLYVEAPSTSEAAAKACGWLSAHLGEGWYDALVQSDLNAHVEASDRSDGEELPKADGQAGVSPAADVQIYWKLSSGVLHISATRLDSTYQGPAYPHNFDQGTVPWYSQRKSITRAVVDNTVAPTTCAYWFSDCTSLASVDLSKLNTSDVVSTANMFNNCQSLEAVDVSAWNMGKNADFFQMFYNCKKLKSLNVKRWNMSSAQDLRSLFDSCVGLTSMDVSTWDTRNVTTMKNLFKDCSGLVTCNVSGLKTSNVRDMTFLFYGCSALTALDVSKWDVSKVESLYFAFKGCSSLTTLNVSAWNVGQVKAMDNLFNECTNLAKLDVSRWNTAKVETMSNTFNGCQSLKSLDVSSWNTSSVTDMHGMFANCSLLNGLDVSGFNTSRVRDMSAMFAKSPSLSSVDLSRWNTSQVTTFKRMFLNCSSLSQLNLSSFNTSSATDMESMFMGCSGLGKLDLSGFKTSSVTNMGQMFAGCSALKTLNIRGFDAGKATNMGRMFAGCSKLSSVTLGAKFSFKGNGITDVNAQAILPTPPSSKPYTGRWANSSVAGYPSATPANLRSSYNGSTNGGAYAPGTFVWERLVTYHFDPNCDDAQGSASDVLAGPDAKVRMPKGVYTRAMFNHLTWNTSPDGTGTYHAPGSTLTNKVNPYGNTTDVTLYAIWEGKQISVRVPVAIHYVADQQGAVRGPDDDVAKISNNGEANVALDGIRAEAYEPWHFVAEGAEPADRQMSLGMRLGNSKRLDFSALDGSTANYARLAPTATLGLRDLRGVAGEGMSWDEWELGCLHWHFSAVE